MNVSFEFDKTWKLIDAKDEFFGFAIDSSEVATFVVLQAAGEKHCLTTIKFIDIT